jgi:hypothetical protein
MVENRRPRKLISWIGIVKTEDQQGKQKMRLCLSIYFVGRGYCSKEPLDFPLRQVPFAGIHYQ